MGRVESAKQRLQEQHAMLGLNRDSSDYERREAMGNPNLRRWSTTRRHARVLARALTNEALSGGLPSYLGSEITGTKTSGFSTPSRKLSRDADMYLYIFERNIPLLSPRIRPIFDGVRFKVTEQNNTSVIFVNEE